jgi:hypothetical protein
MLSHMTTCRGCASADLHWFRPGDAAEGGVFLCRQCGQLTLMATVESMRTRVWPAATRSLRALAA